MAKESFSIYRLNDLAFVWNASVKGQQIGNIAANNQYDSVRLREDSLVLHGFNLKLFHRQHTGNGIFEFLSWIFPQWTQSVHRNRDLYTSKTNHDLLFFYNDSCIYCISTGSWYRVIEQYIDPDFSSHILKKNLDPSFKHSETRNISWQTYATEQIFRWNYQLNRTEAFWKIFKQLSWKLRRDSLLKRFFATERDISSSIKSNCIKIWKALTIEELASLINQLEVIRQSDITEEEATAFSFFDSLQPVLIDEARDTIKREFFAQKILPYLRRQTRTAPDVEFCSSDHIGAFFSVNYAEIGVRGRQWTEIENFWEIDILDYIRDNFFDEWFEEWNDQAYERWESISFRFYGDNEWRDNPINSKLYKLFHGEIVLNGTVYFLIDDKVYRLNESFRQSLEADVINTLSNSNNIINTLPFESQNVDGLHGGQQIEWAFNEYHWTLDHFLCCDRVCVKWIELCDLLYERENQLYIIHVKYWFDAKMRDVSSQIEIAAKQIEWDIQENRDSPQCIVGLYNKIMGYRGDNEYRIRLRDQVSSIGRQWLIDMFLNKERIYVIGLITEAEITRENLNNYSSNIARYELVSSNIHFKNQHGWKWKIAFITPPSN